MRGAKCCMPPNNKCQRCGYLPQQSNANPTGLLKSNWHLSNVWDMWISIYLSIYLYTQTHTHTAQERSGKGGGAELSQWVGSCCLLFRFQHLVSRTLSLWLFHTATERASCFPLADPTSLTYPFLHFISRNYCQGVHKWLLHWAWFLIQLLETICGPSRWCDETERQWSSGEEWKHSPSNTKLSELRSCVKVEVDVLGSHP